MRDSLYWEIIQTIHIQQLSQIHFQDEYCKVMQPYFSITQPGNSMLSSLSNEDGATHITQRVQNW